MLWCGEVCCGVVSRLAFLDVTCDLCVVVCMCMLVDTVYSKYVWCVTLCLWVLSLHVCIAYSMFTCICVCVYVCV